MGTRADFYVGRGENAEWLGSIAWDGYPDGIDTPVLEGLTEELYREAVQNFLDSRDDAAYPENGWPWPWEDSRTTDYAYAYEDGEVWASCFGSAWYDASTDFDWYDEDTDTERKPEGPKAVFPDMTHLQRVTYGKRSGVLVFGVS